MNLTIISYSICFREVIYYIIQQNMEPFQMSNLFHNCSSKEKCSSTKYQSFYQKLGSVFFLFNKNLQGIENYILQGSPIISDYFCINMTEIYLAQEIMDD